MTHSWHEYVCGRCDVTWRARDDERIPDVCWLCERNDATTVRAQCGMPVRYFTEEVGGR